MNDNSVKTEDATTVLCDTASAVDHVESGHTALSSVDHVESEHATPSSEELPECWDFNKKNEFCNRYAWLVVKNKKNLAAELAKQLVLWDQTVKRKA